MAKKADKSFVCLILAAGQGTRMKSDTPKVLHHLCGMPMIDHVVQTVQKLAPEKMFLIVGFKKEFVHRQLGNAVEYINQDEQLGTGHAVMQASDALADYKGDVLVLYGDVPLISKETLEALLDRHRTTRASATIVTTNVGDPHGFGRIIRNRSRKISMIV